MVPLTALVYLLNCESSCRYDSQSSIYRHIPVNNGRAIDIFQAAVIPAFKYDGFIRIEYNIACIYIILELDHVPA